MGTARNIEGTDSPVEAEDGAVFTPRAFPEDAAIEEVIPEDAYKQNHIYRLLVRPSSSSTKPE